LQAQASIVPPPVFRPSVVQAAVVPRAVALWATAVRRRTGPVSGRASLNRAVLIDPVYRSQYEHNVQSLIGGVGGRTCDCPNQLLSVGDCLR
ncbi:hypothetical protein, partial [Actinomadura sp. KC216]|uniref:hypothetical protein n=1 Tax=Actinomadura sp. KC216 TaxID=2530370 RepID=UPI001A9F69C2